MLLFNGNRDSVEFFSEINIPPGLIANYKVTDQNKLAQLLSLAWNQLGIKEKYVGIIIPEFSTFIKYFKLPKIGNEELDEAVRWQARDVLPGTDTDIILDWKIIESDEKEYGILVVAIPTGVLSGYVNAVGLAGLYPLVVETPALALSRLSDSKESGKLIVYLSNQEALIVIAKGDKIYGSSITQINDASIIEVTERIVRHYSDIKIERIVVGGVGFTQSLTNSLAQRFAIQPVWMTIQINGLNLQQIQQYLIPISLQSKDPKEPRDEYSINLLPPEWVKNYENKKERRQISDLLINSTLILLTIFILTFGFYLSQNSHLKNIKKESVNATDEAYLTTLAEAQKINETSDKVLQITSQLYYPQEIVNEIVDLKKDGIDIKSYKINFDTGEVLLMGVASNRPKLIDFKSSLEDKEMFTEVTLPLKSLEKEIDLEFTINLRFKSVQKKQDEGTIQIENPAE